MTPRTPPVNTDARRDLVDVARAYNKNTLGHPSPFFPTPEPVEPTLAAAGDGPLGTQVVDITFPSSYRPYLAVARELHLAHVENQTAHARWWTSDRGRPTIVLIHGWGGGNYWFEQRAFGVPYWLRHGYDVVVFQLPFHGARAAAGSAALPAFPSPNPLRTNEGFGQAIYDLRALAAWLRARGSSAVGVMGMSLGGYTTALWASVAGPADDGGVDFAVAMIPAVSMASLMWRHGEQSPARRRAQRAGITEDLVADAFAVHAPLTRPARLPSDRLFVVAGRGDRICPPDQAELLAAHWQTPVRWFQGGHLAQLGRNETFRDVRRALGGLGLRGRAFRS